VAARKNAIPLIVDPKGTDFSRYGKATLIKPNLSELAAALGRSLLSDEDVEAGLRQMLEQISAHALLVTRSEKGLSFMERGENVVHFPAEKRDVYDVSGAGDTSLAALGIALGAGASLKTASRYALLAAGIAVGKPGTAVVSDEEIRDELSQRRIRSRAGVRAAQDPLTRLRAWKSEGLRIGFTNGCFDILHAGHLSLLEFAASHCDRLIVGLNSDASVSRLKGASRPINPQNDRATLLSGLKAVDSVMIFEDDTPFNLIRQLEPDVLIKGGDYTIETIVGADVVLNRGGEVLIAPTLEGRSTTNIISKSKN
jgi:D-beta-D-heptose 7-phosphate kinase/D-beta-D-heptose 1-phosphate adenosyltransferase